MPNPEPRDEYGPSGSVPDISPSTEGPGQRVRAEATPGAFGAQVGEAKESYGGAVQGAGIAVNEEVNKFHQMAVEAKANEAIVNQWAPAAAQLRQGYDTLRGQDKIAGYDDYIKNLQSGANKFVEDSSGPYEKQIRSQWVTRHISNEIDGAKREQVAAIQQFEDDAHAGKLLLHQTEMVDNYQDPAIVQQNQQMMDAQVLKHAIDNGADPNDPVHAVMIVQAQKDARGEAAVGMVGKAIQDGNIDTAVSLYSQNARDIPGHEQIAIDETLRTASVNSTSQNNTAAILSGLPLPNGVGRPPLQAQMAVVRAADTVGVDGNQALTIARIESSYGQNVGSRGDIGQTGKPGDLQQQSENMAVAIKDAEAQASRALGRKPEPWETYVTYQQGSGGGPALLKASTESPNTRAVDVLKSLYKNPADAIGAITNNGGNVTMTSGQFLDFIKKKYAINSEAAKCEVPGTIAKSFSDNQDQLTGPQAATPLLLGAMSAQHETYGPALQKGSNPKDDLVNFDKIYAPALAQASLITNVDERDGTIRALNKRRESYSAAASAYDTVLNDQLEKILKDPQFTDPGQIPPELASQLNAERLNLVERVAENHVNAISGIATKDMKEYGPGMFGLMRQIHDGEIKSPEDLLGYLPDPKNGKRGEITLAGYKQLITEFTKTPEKASEGRIRTEALSIVKSQIMNDSYGMKDPQGLTRWSTAMPTLMKAWEDGISNGVSSYELSDPSSPKYFGNSVKSLIRTPTQKAIDTVAVRPLNSMIADYKSTSFQWKKDMLLQEMKEAGYNIIDDTNSAKPQAPVSK